MPRQDWRNDDDFMIRDDRERSRGDYRDRSRDYGGYEDRDRRPCSATAVNSAPGAAEWADGEACSMMRVPAGVIGCAAARRSQRALLRIRRQRSGIATDETERLIASNKVEGTPVFDRHGDRWGRSTTSWSTSSVGGWSMPCSSTAAASSGSTSATIRSTGTSSPTTRGLAAITST